MTLAEVLMDVKQEVFNEMVEGNSRQPAEVVDRVVYALQDAGISKELMEDLWPVLNFYPDYTG